MSPAATATKPGRWFSGGKNLKRTEAPIRVLTAAATRLNLIDKTQARRMRALRQGWQLEAWAYRASIGELRYAVNFLANCMARMRIYPAAYPMAGESDNPLALSEVPGVPQQILDAASQAMADLGNGKLAISGLLHSLSTNITVPGEAFLLGQEDPQTGNQVWSIRSVSELVIYDDAYKLREVPMDPQGILGWEDLDPELTVASRMWVPDPQFRILADSPLKAIMDDCESLLILRRMIRATGRSRLAGRGILLIPNELSISVPTDDENDPEADPFMAELTQVMTEPINEEGVASAVVPQVIRGPGDQLALVRWMEFASTFDEMSSKTREELVGIIATGLDIPKEVITGMADLNHWSAWAVDDNTFRHHVEPHVVTACDCLTSAYLRPYIANCDLDPAVIEEWTQRLVFWYDPTELVTHPDQTSDAFQLHDRMAISDEAMRRTAGFEESDKPSAEEFEARQFQHIKTLPPNLLMEFARRYDPTLIVPPITEAGTIPGIKPGGVDVGPPLPPPGTPPAAPPPAELAPPAPIAPPAPEPGPPPITAAAKIKPSAKSLRLSRKLVAIDADLRARLHTAANAAMMRKLEKAGGRLRQKVAKDETLRNKIALTRNEHVAAVLGRQTVESLTAATLVDSDWATLQQQYYAWTRAAQEQAISAARQLAGLDNDANAVSIAKAAMEQGIDAGWTNLSNSLTEMSHNALYNPHPNLADPTLDDLNPDTVVPTGTIRTSLGIAGGSEDGAPTGGQIGTGATVQDLITSAGGEITGYVWVHGPALKPFEPHEDLDGVEFTTFDDDVLANDGDFPDNQYYVPGDHVGCFPGATIVSGPAAASATLRDWQGEMIEVCFASGQLLTATPNHPILTPHGWIPLGLLDEGDEVLRCVDAERITGLVPNRYQVPARIEEVADAVGVTGDMISRRVEVAPEDFHGDGSGSEVAVVRSDRHLRNRLDVAVGQPSSQGDLTGTHPVAGIALAGKSGASQLLGTIGLAPLSGMSSLHSGVLPFGGGLFIDQASGVLRATPFDASGEQSLADRAPVHAEVDRETVLGLTSLVSPDKIIQVDRYAFSGQVFNLDTRVGWYIADGILVHNCSCDFDPQFASASDTADDSGDTESEGDAE